MSATAFWGSTVLSMDETVRRMQWIETPLIPASLPQGLSKNAMEQEACIEQADRLALTISEGDGIARVIAIKRQP